MHRSACESTAGQRQAIANWDGFRLVRSPAGTLKPRHAGPQSGKHGGLVERDIRSG
jgi:hypothetical protein